MWKGVLCPNCGCEYDERGHERRMTVARVIERDHLTVDHGLAWQSRECLHNRRILADEALVIARAQIRYAYDLMASAR